MNSRTSLILVLLLGVVFGIAFWQNRQNDPIVDAAPTKLFAGLNSNGLRKLRLEHTQRGLQLTMERRDDGWWITDPVEHPADAGVIGLLMQIVEYNEVIPITQSEPDLAALGFEPPVGIIDVTAENPDGTRVNKLVEMGAADLDGRHVYVRVDGRVGRTVRNITNTLERNLDEFRSTRAIVLEPGQIVEVHRTGYNQAGLESERVELDLSAFLDGTRWVSTVPVSAALDPRMMEVVCRASTMMPIMRHIEDVPEDLSIFGLDQPWWRIAVRTYSGEERALLFARTSVDNGRWFVQREGQTAVFEVDPLAVSELLRPVDELVDPRALQEPKTAITGIEYRSESGGVRLTRVEQSWTVSERRGEDWGGPQAADPTLVAEFLDRLAQTSLTEPRMGVDAPAFQPAGELRIATNEETQRIALGDSPRYFSRHTEDVVYLCDDWLLERLARSADSWRSLQLLRIDEVGVRALTLSRDGVERRWVRSEQGLWTLEGQSQEARELLKVLDALLFLRGKGHLPADAEPLARAIAGEFEFADGEPVRFLVGLAKDDRGVLREAASAGGRRAFVSVVGLHARLAGLVGE